MVRESAEQARTMPDGSAVVDLIEISMVELDGRVRRSDSEASFVVSGVSAERFMSTPPIQVVDGDVVRTSVPIIAGVGAVPIAANETQFSQYLEATPFIPVEHRRIEEQSAEIIEGYEGRLEATRALVDWVYGYLEKRSTVGVPNALEVLEVGQGDCNEHTVLFVALARAAGIPTKTVAGMVFMPDAERSNAQETAPVNGAFYYHAWPEVYMGEQVGWMAVDPTFGEFPANAFHLKVVEGGLDKQIEIMGMLGRVRLSVEQSDEVEETP
jgi:transglutaminase-like putative cysteine protease